MISGSVASAAQAAAATRDGEAAEAAARYPYLLEVVGELAKEGYDYDAEVLRGSWRDG